MRRYISKQVTVLFLIERLEFGSQAFHVWPSPLGRLTVIIQSDDWQWCVILKTKEEEVISTRCIERGIRFIALCSCATYVTVTVTFDDRVTFNAPQTRVPLAILSASIINRATSVSFKEMTQQHRVNVTRAYSGVLDEKYDDMNGEDGEEEESGWEDEGGMSPFMQSRTGSPSESSNFRMARRRRRPARGAKKQVVSTRSTTTAKTASKADDEPPVIAREDVVHGLVHGSLFTGKYALDIFKRALHLLRYPLSFLFCLYILAFIMNKMEHTFKSLFSPICIVPGLGKTRFCHTPPPSPPGQHRPARWADYPHLVDVESKTFEQLMDGVVGGSALSLEVKQAEMATADLAALVRISDLKAKDTLASSLLDFIDSAKKTGRGLQRLSSKVGGAVDR